MKQRILAVYHNLHWLLVAAKLLTAKLHSFYVKESEVENFGKVTVRHFTSDSATLAITALGFVDVNCRVITVTKLSGYCKWLISQLISYFCAPQAEFCALLVRSRKLKQNCLLSRGEILHLIWMHTSVSLHCFCRVKYKEKGVILFCYVMFKPVCKTLVSEFVNVWRNMTMPYKFGKQSPMQQSLTHFCIFLPCFCHYRMSWQVFGQIILVWLTAVHTKENLNKTISISSKIYSSFSQVAAGSCCSYQAYFSVLQSGLRSWSRNRKELEIFGWSWCRIHSIGGQSRIFCPTPTPDVELDHFLNHNLKLGSPVEMVQFLLKQISCCEPQFPLILTAKFCSLYVNIFSTGWIRYGDIFTFKDRKSHCFGRAL